MPEVASSPVSVTSTAPAYQPLASDSATFAVVVGAVRSILMLSTVVLAWLPALSATDAEAERLAPSPATGVSAGASPARPESASEAVHATTTSPLYQPLAFGSVVTLPLSLGSVLSTLTPPTPAVAWLPAASATVA